MIINPTFKQQPRSLLRKQASHTPDLKSRLDMVVRQDCGGDTRSKSRLDTLETERLTNSFIASPSDRRPCPTERRGERAGDLRADRLLETTLQAQSLQAQLARQTPVLRKSPKHTPKIPLFAKRTAVSKAISARAPAPKAISAKAPAHKEILAKAPAPKAISAKTPVSKLSSCRSLAAARYEAKARRILSQEELRSSEGGEWSQ
jgi:hypothetical protein